jgi:hypothetical protein
MQSLVQELQCILVAGQGVAVHKNIESGILTLNDAIQAGCYHSESSGDICR